MADRANRACRGQRLVSGGAARCRAAAGVRLDRGGDLAGRSICRAPAARGAADRGRDARNRGRRPFDAGDRERAAADRRAGGAGDAGRSAARRQRVARHRGGGVGAAGRDAVLDRDRPAARRPDRRWRRADTPHTRVPAGAGGGRRARHRRRVRGARNRAAGCGRSARRRRCPPCPVGSACDRERRESDRSAAACRRARPRHRALGAEPASRPGRGRALRADAGARRSRRA